MTNSLKTLALAIAWVSTMMVGQSVYADEIVTTTTKSVTTTTVPSVLITATQTRVPIVALEKAVVVVVKVVPEDLIVRRDDLLARIIVERANGWLSSDQADRFTDRVMTVDSTRAHLTNDGSRLYYQQVKDMYGGYDKIAADMETTSGKGDRELAGLYKVIY